METLPIGAMFEPKKGQESPLERARLTEQDFLQVLVAQLRNQNPLAPASDSDFIAQLAQFEQLASLNRMNETLSALTGLSLLGQAASLLGREVTAWQGDGVPSLTGVVEGVEFTDGAAMLRINEQLISLAAVLVVREADPGADAG